MDEKITDSSQKDIYTLYTQFLKNDKFSSSALKKISATNPTKSVGSSANDFKILQEIGKGASSIVYKIQALTDNSIYAMKVIPIKHLKPHQQKEALVEVFILKKIQHENIIKFYDSFIEDDKLFIITECAEQGDLYSLIRNQQKKKMYVPEKRIWRFLWHLCLAALHLHVHNVIHGDIKALNIFLTKDRILKVFWLFNVVG